MKKIKANGLMTNTIMLYVLTFSNYFFNFITVPYQTRVLGPVYYGRLGFATAFMVYIQLFLDFGFLLSATEEVANFRNDKKAVSRIFSVVCWCKLILIAASLIVLLILCGSVERFRSDSMLFILYFVSTAVNSFLPDYLYRGLEDMKSITVRSVCIKLFFTVMIFVFLREPSQYYIVPLLNIIGNVGAVVFVYADLKKRVGVGFVKVSLKEVLQSLKRSSIFFYSRIASTVYSATNTFIMGFIYGDASPIVGYYTSADKLITTAKQAITPVTDSLYPYMVRKKDFKLIRKLMMIGLPVMTAGCIGVWILAEPICGLLFGNEFVDSAKYLRLLIPAVWCSFPAMTFGFPVLSPMGLAKYANISNIFGACIQIIQLIILYFAGGLTVEALCIATCITEVCTLSFRVLVVFFNRKKLNTSV